MEKKSFNNLKFVSFIVGVVATFMAFLPALVEKNFDLSYTGIQVAFGHEFDNLGGFAQLEFSFLNILAYSLPLVAALLLFFSSKEPLISTILFGGAIVLLFLVPEFTVATLTVGTITSEVSVNWSYGIGLILAASLSAVGLLISLFRLYKKK